MSLSVCVCDIRPHKIIHLKDTEMCVGTPVHLEEMEAWILM